MGADSPLPAPKLPVVERCPLGQQSSLWSLWGAGFRRNLSELVALCPKLRGKMIQESITYAYAQFAHRLG